MKVTVRTQSLVRDLSLAQGIVEPKATIPVLSNVLLEASEGSLALTSTDLELGIQTSFEAEVSEPGAIPLPMKALFDYVRLLPDADLTITSEDQKPVELSCGTAKATIAGMTERLDRKSYPTLPVMPDSDIKIPAAALANAVQKTTISIAGEESHYTLAAAQFIVRRDAVGFVSTDGHRLSLYIEQKSIPGVEEDIECLVSRKAMNELAKVLAQGGSEQPDVDFAADENNIFFKLGRCLFIARRQTGKFPDYNRVMPKDLNISVELERDPLKLVLQRVKQFADRRTPAVGLVLDNGSLTFNASTSGLGSSEESIAVDYEGEEFRVGFNSDYILEYLGVCGSDKITLRLRDPRSAAQIEVGDSARDTDYRYVVMPIRI